MPASARSPEPLPEVKTHGARGYDLGCGCWKCKAGQNARLKRYRERKAAGTVGTTVPNVIQFPPSAGQFERGVLAMVHEIGAEGAEADLLIDMIVFNAKLLDSIPGSGRWHLANNAQKTIRDLTAELHKLAGGKKPTPSAGEDLEGFLNGLTKQEK